MTPIAMYRQYTENGQISHDENQWQVLLTLEKLHAELMQAQQLRQGFWAKFKKPAIIPGVYLWGGVGIGKTFLMDCFYNTLPFPQKKRIHFHHFMRWVHEQLKLYKGIADPLAKIAKNYAKDVFVLCFDEFIVNDIANAMLLSHLLKAFFKHGICLLATSNTEPDKLYWQGLQREAFLPAIAELKAHMHVIHLTSDTDYRLRQLKDARLFYTPHDAQAESAMQQLFSLLTQHEEADHFPIAIDERLIPIKIKAGHVIWFEFNALCESPLSQNDYIDIAKHYQTVFISNIPMLPEYSVDTIARFINLIDVFYDAHIRIVISAAAPLAALQPKGIKRIEFERTLSRLIEMQSEKYWQ